MSPHSFNPLLFSHEEEKSFLKEASGSLFLVSGRGFICALLILREDCFQTTETRAESSAREEGL